MGIYKNAAELLIKRQFGIYGPERIKLVAKTSGYAIDNSGNILAVGNEEEAFRNFWERIKTDLGPVAVIGSKVTLMRFFSQAGSEMPEWLE
ncbi:MAG: hypothetical protein AABY42_05565 [Nitrospirota bacterium]